MALNASKHKSLRGLLSGQGSSQTFRSLVSSFMHSQKWSGLKPVQGAALAGTSRAIHSSWEHHQRGTQRLFFQAFQKAPSDAFQTYCWGELSSLLPRRFCVAAKVQTMTPGAAEGTVPLVETGDQPSVSSLPPAESLVAEKKALRSVVKKELRQLSKEQRQEEDEDIQRHILDLELFQKATRVCAYLACEPLREVDTKRVVPAALEQGKVLYVPRVEDRAAHMRMLRIKDPDTDTERNSMGIAEPTPLLPDGQPREDVMQADEALDLILMPGLAFDRSGKRLGRGGGYYDVFLQNYLKLAESKGWKRPVLIAMSYEAQIRDSIPADKTDQLVDGLVTVDGLLTFGDQIET